MIVRSSCRPASAQSRFIASMLALAALGTSLLALSGCGPQVTSSANIAMTGAALQGHVQGGQQPVSGAIMQLYAAGTAGDGSGATALISKTVTTDSYGNFNITGDYTCGSNQQVYLVATQGNPGLPGTANNPNLALLAALGPCGQLTPTTMIQINEVTTVGSVAALYPYMSSFTGLGSGPGDASQLTTAFATANEYINVPGGSTPGPALPAGYYASSTEINTLANVLAGCVNTAGGISGDGSACGKLFLYAKPSNGVAPTDTVGAIIDILNNPASNVSSIFGLTTPAAPFMPQLSSAPQNWMLPIIPVPQTPTFTPAAGIYAGAQSVTINESAAGATIYYTVDGSTPTTASAIYSGAITVSASETIKAFASESGRLSSSVASAAYTITAALPAATPTFSPGTGSYTANQSVTISTTTPNALIYYTTDGSTPTTSSTLYSGPVTVYETETLNAIAISAITSTSAVGTATYTIPRNSAIISTFAGNGTQGFGGDGGQATNASFYFPYGNIFDAAGNFYIADFANHRVRKITPAGVVSTIAGNGTAGFSGDGGQATVAALDRPDSLAFDTAGNLYIDDDSNYRIRKVTPAGVISTFAGNGSNSFAGDGGQATSASFSYSCGIITDAGNNLYINDCGDNRIRKVTAAGIISTIVGTGTAGSTGDGGQATAATINNPQGLALDQSGNLYISEFIGARVRKVTPAGIISTYAGNGTGQFSGDGGAATSASIYQPQNLILDAAGTLYIADSGNNRVRTVSTSGIISTIAGNGTPGFAGDGTPAVNAELNIPTSLSLDAAGNLYISDELNERIRKVTFGAVAPPAPAPTFSLPAGTYNGTQTVVISGAAPGGSIYYTVDGTTPTTASTVYTAPITVAASETINAIATGTFYSASPVATAAYTITNIPVAAQPAFSPTPGSYTSTQSVTLSTTTAGATIYYTTDGSTPTTSSKVYSSAISVSSSETISAIAVASGYITSSTATGGYFINQGTGIIITVAGNGTGGFAGDGGAATSAEFDLPQQVAQDQSGNLYVADYFNNRIRKVTPAGVISTVAGTGASGFSGDGGPATSATLYDPYGVAVDAAGNLYIADSVNERIRKVNTSGIISTIAGTGAAGFSGDNGPATSASINRPYGLAVDGAGNVYVADSTNERIRKIGVNGIITTVAGNGTGGFAGDGNAATSAELYFPQGVALDSAGNLYIADTDNNRIRKVSTSGIISTVAGSSSYGYSGDGGAATSAGIGNPSSVAVDSAGNLYLSDNSNQRIRKVTASTGLISTIAGTGSTAYNGDGEPATSANLSYPTGVLVDSIGNVYLSDLDNERVRKIVYGNGLQAASPVFSLSGTPSYTTIQTLYMSTTTPGASIYYTVDGSTPTAASTLYTNSITVASSETVSAIAIATGYSVSPVSSVAYTVNALPVAATPAFSPAPGTFSAAQTVTLTTTTSGATIYYTTDGSAPTTSSAKYTGALTVSSSETINAIAVLSGYTNSSTATGGFFINQGPGIITTYAGTGTYGFTGDGGQATSAQISNPYQMALDSAGNLYFADQGNNRVRKITPAGIISTVAGSSTAGFSGDNGPATSAALNYPAAVVVDSSGNLYIADSNNQRIRKVTAAGIISTVAGTGTAGFTGDGGQATAAQLYSPISLAVDSMGNLYVADQQNERIRRINPVGIISTIAGNGTAGFTGDGGAATSAELNLPKSIALDLNGNLYVADYSNDRIRKITSAGIISTVAGTGAYGSAGDGGQATAATFQAPWAVSVDTAGNFYIADLYSARVRKVNAAGVISTIAGTGNSGYNGDGGLATSATLDDPEGLAVDSTGNVYIADLYNQRIRKIIYGNGIQSAAPSFSVPAGSYTTTQYLTLSTPTPNATLYYTLDGTTPTVASTPYTTPIAISSNETVTAITTATGYSNSAAAAVTYMVTVLPNAVPPTFSPAPGVFTTAQTVTLAAASGTSIYYTLDGSLPTTSSTLYTGAITVSTSETIRAIAAQSGYNPSTVAAAGYYINLGAGTINTIAGDGGFGFAGDGSAATSASLYYPEGIAFDSAGNLYIADQDNSRIRKVNSGQIISTYAGNNSAAFAGDNGPATSASLYYPAGVAVDNSGNVYIADTSNNRVRKVTPAGIISTVAGNGTSGFTGDGGNALSAELSAPRGVAVDAAGNLYIADTNNYRIRKVTLAGIITTVAGSGGNGYNGDNIAATTASLANPYAVAVDAAGNLYIADYYNYRVRKVNTSGIISTYAGTGSYGFAGDGTAATSAGVKISYPTALAVDSAGNVYFSDSSNYRVRVVNPAGILSTAVGNGTSGFTGDLGPAMSAEIGSVFGLTTDSAGSVYVSDGNNQRVRKVTH